ncbi:dihydropyrimidine dehydrogenase subunit A [Planctomycetota bacterium]|nr:dihydropyrimidine dehydrogenase subunit A [Planctomycetota bacterium]
MGDPKGFMNHTRQAPHYLPVEARLANHEEHIEVLPEAQVKTQASRCMDCGVPFCMSGCPLGNLIPDWNDLVFRGKWREALAALHATNNFPEFTGRVCPAPCENSCVLGINEPPVTIKLHEVSIVDHGFAQGWIRPEAPPVRTGKRVAVIGGGPAGLASAQQLNRAGHQVTVFEKNDRAGGLLMYGIPHYKLRKEKVQRRIDLLTAEGIELRTGVTVGGDLPWDQVKSQFDAVVISTGAEAPRDLPVPGRDLDGVHFAMEFLPQSNRSNWGDTDIAALHPKKQRIWAEGKHVIVIGGGDTGSDCIGTSLRQGAASVTNFELLPEPPGDRPANNPWPQWARIRRISSSVEEMTERGGEVAFSLATKSFTGENGKVTSLTTIQLDWKTGKPVEVPGSERTWRCDLALLAMGFLGPKKNGLLEQVGCQLDQRGNIATDAKTRMSTVPGVFAAGDARRGQSLIVWAISEGREVARCVDEWLMQRPSLLPAVRIEAFAY